MAKLYTSRFSNKELETGKYTVVGVVRSMPKFLVKYRISGDIIQIAPPGYLWNENNRERFRNRTSSTWKRVDTQLSGESFRHTWMKARTWCCVATKMSENPVNGAID